MFSFARHRRPDDLEDRDVTECEDSPDDGRGSPEDSLEDKHSPEETANLLSSQQLPPKRRRGCRTWFSRCWSGPRLVVVLVALACLGAGFLAGELIQDRGLLAKLRHDHRLKEDKKGKEGSPQQAAAAACETPAVRAEWRSLSATEQREYIGAARCLLEKPAQTRPSGRLYDDFAYIYGMLGRYSLNSASFLPWHRLFLHRYEAELRSSCAYAGRMPYWDWTRDWEALAGAPVFANETFGGDGQRLTGPDDDTDTRPTHLPPYPRFPCVRDGSFADLELPFVWFALPPSGAIDAQMHCLRRRFSGEAGVGHHAAALAPQAVRDLVDNAASYEDLRQQLEDGPHAAVAAAVGGDFRHLIGPGDPVWFLHMGNIDRLWWMWQTQGDHGGARLSAYAGQANSRWPDRATLDDWLSLGWGLRFSRGDVRVADVMSTAGGLLCYTY